MDSPAYLSCLCGSDIGGEKCLICLDKDCRAGRLRSASKEGGVLKFITERKDVIRGNYKELPEKFGNLDNLLGGRNGCYN